MSQIVRPVLTGGVTQPQRFLWTLSAPGGSYAMTASGPASGVIKTNLGSTLSGSPLPAFAAKLVYSSLGGVYLADYKDNGFAGGVSNSFKMNVYALDSGGGDMYIAAVVGFAGILDPNVEVGIEASITNLTATNPNVYGFRFELELDYNLGVNSDVHFTVVLDSSLTMVG